MAAQGHEKSPSGEVSGGAQQWKPRREDTGRANSQEASLGHSPSFLLVTAGGLYEPGVISPYLVTPVGAPTSAVPG